MRVRGAIPQLYSPRCREIRGIIRRSAIYDPRRLFRPIGPFPGDTTFGVHAAYTIRERQIDSTNLSSVGSMGFGGSRIVRIPFIIHRCSSRRAKLRDAWRLHTARGGRRAKSGNYGRSRSDAAMCKPHCPRNLLGHLSSVVAQIGRMRLRSWGFDRMGASNPVLFVRAACFVGAETRGRR